MYTVSSGMLPVCSGNRLCAHPGGLSGVFPVLVVLYTRMRSYRPVWAFWRACKRLFCSGNEKAVFSAVSGLFWCELDKIPIDAIKMAVWAF